jgi:CRISPR-associated endonuclease/helicase Cas3
MNIEAFYNKAVGFHPNPLQEAVWEAFMKDAHPSLVVRAGTGAGKTEAALLPALAAGRRVVMVLPSKALIEDMGRRILKITERLTSCEATSLAVTVDMGGSCRRYGCSNGKSEAKTYMRHLFADDVIITTLDKFLFRLFGYGEKVKSYIFPHRVFGSSLGKQPFVIFDEAHEYDDLAFSNFSRLLEALYTRGKDLCVMSATLPAGFADFLELVDAAEGPLADRQKAFQIKECRMIHPEKKLTLIPVPKGSGRDWDGLLSAMEQEIRKRYDSEKRIIIRTELVRDLISLYERIKDLKPFVYHGRLTARQRRGTIDELLRIQHGEDGDRLQKGFLVLATSAIEAGCDIDAHIIVTQLCNPDSLIQLAGRLNRRAAMTDAELVIVGNTIEPSVRCIDVEEMAAYIDDLHGMGASFSPAPLARYFRPAQGDWMGEILFDMLWDYVYEGDLTAKPLWDRGILVTRSWEPSVTICTGLDRETNAPINPVQIGLSRFGARPGKNCDELKDLTASELLAVEPAGEWHAEIYRRYYKAQPGEGGKWVVLPLHPGKTSGYQTDLLCVVGKEFEDAYFDKILGYRQIPKLFIRGGRRGFERTFLYRPQIKKDRFSCENGRFKDSGRLWFIETE